MTMTAAMDSLRLYTLPLDDPIFPDLAKRLWRGGPYASAIHADMIKHGLRTVISDKDLLKFIWRVLGIESWKACAALAKAEEKARRDGFANHLALYYVFDIETRRRLVLALWKHLARRWLRHRTVTEIDRLRRNLDVLEHHLYMRLHIAALMNATRISVPPALQAAGDFALGMAAVNVLRANRDLSCDLQHACLRLARALTMRMDSVLHGYRIAQEIRAKHGRRDALAFELSYMRAADRRQMQKKAIREARQAYNLAIAKIANAIEIGSADFRLDLWR